MISADTRLRRRPRLLDVAIEAGVSLGAASKAMSRPSEVRPATLAAVSAAVDKLGYVASDRGRALATRQNGTVGIVLPTISNAVFANFVHVLQKSLWSSDHQLLVLSHEYDRDLEVAQVRRLVRRDVDALILVGTDHRRDTRDLLAKLRFPHLFTWSTDDACPERVIGFSNRKAMYAVIDHLAALGHRRIAVFGGVVSENERARWRLVGIREAAERAGIEIAVVRTIDLTIDAGRRAFDDLDPLAIGVTAIVCATDTLAAGALDAAKSRGIAVPGQLSISGFDDIEISSLLSPALTTIHAPVAEMAMLAGDTVRSMMAGGDPPSSVELPTSLVVRQSTGEVHVD